MNTINLRKIWIFKWESTTLVFEKCVVWLLSKNSVERRTYNLKAKEKKSEKGKGKKNHKPYSSKPQTWSNLLANRWIWFGDFKKVSKYNTEFLWQITEKQWKSQFPAHFILSNPIVKLHLQLTNIHSHIVIKLHLSFTAPLRLSSKTLIFPAPVLHFNFA